MTIAEKIAREKLGWKCSLMNHENNLWDVALDWSAEQASLAISDDNSVDRSAAIFRILQGKTR